jgi:hypothetical protein
MPHSQILASPPDRDSLFNSVLEVSFWTIVWFGVTYLTRITVNIPSSIAKETDEHKKESRIQEYVNYLVSLYHAILLISTTGLCFIQFPIVRNRPLTDFEMFIMKVGILTNCLVLSRILHL